MSKKYKVRGMTCNHCKEKIEKALKKKKDIKDAKIDLRTGILDLEYKSNEIALHSIKKVISQLGYELVEVENENKAKIGMVIGVTVILFFLVNRMIPDFSTLLTAGNSLSLIMLFLIGITTSFHCVSMCGGIALSQVSKEKDNFKRNIMYNVGRMISYTLLGGIVGALGAGITLGNSFFAIVPIVLGVLMVIIGLSNAGMPIVPHFKLTKQINMKLAYLRGKVSYDKGPFVLGLVNGLMPCGPLQLMQIYALGTGSFMQGALAMLAFSIGTVPLMLGLGLFINKLSIASKELVFKVGGYLVVFLGIGMVMNGLTTMGINTSTMTRNNVGKGVVMEDGYQVLRIDVEPRGYENVVIQKDIPTKLIFDVAPGDLTSCNYAVNIPEYEVFQTLQEGENIIEFIPEEVGTFPYSCWMGMIRSKITVVEDDISEYVPEVDSSPFQPMGTSSGFKCH